VLVILFKIGDVVKGLPTFKPWLNSFGYEKKNASVFFSFLFGNFEEVLHPAFSFFFSIAIKNTFKKEFWKKLLIPLLNFDKIKK
jgi:hypothetical protein